MKRHKQKVVISGVNTADIKVLKNKEMMEMFVAYQAGDYSKREELIKGNLKLVLSVLRQFVSRGANPDDLFQIGCIGLIKAIDNFDLSHGVRFSTYAVPMIMGEIRRYLRDNSPMRISRSIKDVAYKALKEKEKLIELLQREPSITEIANSLELPEMQVKQALEAMVVPMSLYDPIYDDGGDTIFLIDQLKDNKTSTDKWEFNISLERALKRLNDREKFILNQRFFVGKTQMEVADEIGISQAQVSRLEKNAIKSIKLFIK